MRHDLYYIEMPEPPTIQELFPEVQVLQDIHSISGACLVLEGTFPDLVRVSLWMYQECDFSAIVEEIASLVEDAKSDSEYLAS